MRTQIILSIAGLAVAGAGLTASSNGGDVTPSTSVGSGHVGHGERGETRVYGAPVRVGQGRARAYVVYDDARGGTLLEVGVALDEGAMNGLPAPNPHAGGKTPDGHEHLDSHVYLLSLPARGAAPYRFVELDWNPGGHEPPGIYDRPHFDFHFWTTSRDVRESIVPTDPQFQQKADMFPPEAQVPLYYAVAAPPGAPAPGVPLMGVHWVDVRSPELQNMYGNPDGYRPFTTTFIYGSWAGRFVFLEPMITRDHILAKKTATDAAVRDEVIPISTPVQVGAPGHYPSAYRIVWDARAREFRIALTQMARRD
jgi:hypothetical protein